MPKKTVLLFFICSHQFCFSQIQKTEKDSLADKNNIENISKNNKTILHLPRFLLDSTNSKAKVTKTRNRAPFEGKTIRNIQITTLDPFGFSINDSTKKPLSWAEKTGNRLHLKTKELAIKNSLLFKKNSIYHSYEIKESERIIRSQNFIREVYIAEKVSDIPSDSVDIFIRVLDSWSTAPHLEISNSSIALGLNERNFLGFGHQMDYKFTNRHEDKKSANSIIYQVPNIKNTFIRAVINYQIDLFGYYQKNFHVERPFYSALTKWAGGINLGLQFKTDTIQRLNSAYANQNFKYGSQDFWFAKSFNVSKENDTNDKTTNLILSARFLNKNFIESPTIQYDSIQFYSSEKFTLIGIGINNRKFIEDQYLFKNGIIEDVPIGRIAGITLGYQYKNEVWRPYLGAQFSFGNYHNWGFLSTNFELGTFFAQSKTEQTAFSFQANYFTKLQEIRNWKWRQFIKPQIIIGNNRKKSIGDQLTINENFGIQGFNSPIYGTDKAVLTLQTQAYSPKDIWGFRMNPYFNYSVAALGNKLNKAQKRKVYSKIGIGLIINNDYWIFSSFQLSLSYYPSIPFEGENVFKTNAFETSDFGFQSFELAQPKIVEYK